MRYSKGMFGERLTYGFATNRFILGIYIDKDSISLDFGFIWIMVEP